MYSNVNIAWSIEPDKIATDTNGTGIDLRGYDSAVIIAGAATPIGVSSGSITDLAYGGGRAMVFELEESDDNSTYTDVAAADMIGSFPANRTSGTDGITSKVGYIGDKRYIRVVANISGSASTPVFALVARCHAHQRPVS
jgi:hypothetical protein